MGRLGVIPTAVPSRRAPPPEGSTVHPIRIMKGIPAAGPNTCDGDSSFDAHRDKLSNEYRYCTMPAAFALSVVTSAVSTAITMSMTRFSVLLVLSVISSSFLLVVSFEFVNRQLLIVNR